jgi:hypothetical protein
MVISHFSKRTVLFCFLFFSFSLHAQRNTIIKFKAEPTGSLILNNDGYAAGLDLGVEFPLYGNRNWEYTYNFPTVGLSFGGFYFTDMDYITPALYTYPYFLYPFVHINGFAFNVKLGAGIASYIKTGNEETGYIFPVTGLFTGGLNMSIALGKMYGNPYSYWSITFGGDVMLLHNINMTRRAKNLNMLNAHIGLTYTPNVYPLPIKYPAKPVKRILAFEVAGQVGMNQLERADGDHFYPNGSVNAGFYLPITNAYRLGAGADAFYNSVYDGKQRTDNRRYNFIKEDEFINKFRVGLFLANDLTIGRFSAGIHAGVYVLSKIRIPEYDDAGNENKNRTEDFLYTKLVMKYHITPKFMVNLQVKSHLLEMECMEIGFGYAIPDFGSRMESPFKRVSFRKEERKDINQN